MIPGRRWMLARNPVARKSKILARFGLTSSYMCIYILVSKRGAGMARKQRTEDLIAQECLAVRLRMINRVVTNIYDQALRPLGVKASQLNILVVAAKMGLARPAEVSARLHLDVSTLSRNVERMRNQGWLEVVADEDARAHPFRITPKGRKLLERAKPAWQSAQQKTKKLLGSEIVAALGQATKRL